LIEFDTFHCNTIVAFFIHRIGNIAFFYVAPTAMLLTATEFVVNDFADVAEIRTDSYKQFIFQTYVYTATRYRTKRADCSSREFGLARIASRDDTHSHAERVY
jgi:hypothetical protein